MAFFRITANKSKNMKENNIPTFNSTSKRLDDEEKNNENVQLSSPFVNIDHEDDMSNVNKGLSNTENAFDKRNSSLDYVDNDPSSLVSPKLSPKLMQLRQRTEEGYIPLTLLALFGGIVIIFSSVFGFQEHGLDGFSYNVSIITLFSWLSGIFIVTLEGRIFFFDSPSFHRFVSNYLRMLRFVWGRGILYMFAGSLHICLESQFSTIAGAFLLVVGFITFVIGLKINNSLRNLMKPLREGNLTRDVFDFYDTDKDGFINVEKFRDMIIGLGIEEIDIRVEFDRIDLNKDGLINYLETKKWVQTLNQTSSNSILDYYDIIGLYFTDDGSS